MPYHRNAQLPLSSTDFSLLTPQFLASIYSHDFTYWLQKGIKLTSIMLPSSFKPKANCHSRAKNINTDKKNTLKVFFEDSQIYSSSSPHIVNNYF